MLILFGAAAILIRGSQSSLLLSQPSNLLLEHFKLFFLEEDWSLPQKTGGDRCDPAREVICANPTGHHSQGSKRSFYEHHYTWFILEQLLSRSVRIILLSVISKNEKFDKSIVWWFQSNRRSSKVISVLIWIYIFRPKWQSPRIIRTIIRFHIFKFLCLVSLYILKVGALLMREYPIN